MWTLIEAKTPADELPHIDEPLQLSPAETPARHWWQTSGLLILLLVLAGALSGQFIYFYQQQLLTMGTSRALMNEVCEFAGCTLPPVSDPSQMQISGLSLNSHPDFQNISVLTLSLQNRAAFPQALPDMILQFSNPQGDPVAGRRLSALDYAAEGTSLAAGEMIAVEIAFASPTDNAVNYQLTLASPAL